MIHPLPVLPRPWSGPLPNELSHAQVVEHRNRMKSRDNFCFWCRRRLIKDRGTLDHIIPSCKGGPDTLGNLVLACGTCNNVKGDDLPEVWLAKMERLCELLRQRVAEHRLVMG